MSVRFCVCILCLCVFLHHEKLCTATTHTCPASTELLIRLLSYEIEIFTFNVYFDFLMRNTKLNMHGFGDSEQMNE